MNPLQPVSSPRGAAAPDLQRDLAERRIRARVVRARADELDVLVHSQDRERFEALLRSRGFLAVPAPAEAGRTADRDRRFHVRDGLVVESMSVWAFDPAGGHAYRWIVPGLSEAILDTAPGRGGPFSEAPLCLAHVLHEAINRGARRSDRLRSALVALAAADPGGEAVSRFLGQAAADAVRKARAESLGTGPVDAVSLVRDLCRATRRASLGQPVQHAVRRMHDLWDRAWHRRLGRRQWAISILGPDGVGKTTVANLVASGEPPPRTAWCYRYNGRPKGSGGHRVARRVVKSLWYAWERRAVGRSVPSDDVIRLAEIRMRRLECLAAALVRRLSGNQLLDILLQDRGTIDEAADLRTDRARARARRLIRRALPGSESCSILLVDEPEAIHARKDEKSVGEIASTVRRLRRAMAELLPPENTVEIDIRGLTAVQVARSVEASIRFRLDRESGRVSPVPSRDDDEPELRFFVVGFPGPGAPVSDGVHRAVAGVAGALARDGRRVVIVGQGGESSRYRRDGYDVVTFRGSTRLGLSRELVRWFAARSGPGLTVLNGAFSPLVVALSRRLVRRGQPYVHAPHDPYNDAVFASSPWKKRAWWLFAERRLLREAAAIQVLDPRHGALLRHLGVETPWHAFPNGFRIEDLDEDHAPPPPHDGPARLFFLGRMDAHNKGLDLLLRAVCQVPDTTLTLQGPDWGDAGTLRDLCAELGMTHRVRILAPAYDRTPGSLIAEHDIFCLPSRFEGFGLAALEAMIAERPVLISDVGGLAPGIEAAGCGRVVEPTVESILEGLRDLLARRGEWQRMGAVGRSWAIEHLTWERVAADTWEAYEPLFRPARRP